ncbi:hypothetical protein CKO50_22745 [Pseudoalteromonas sp. HM-SA03]|uniref:hypothetical protein n=1 Tax=Pseudoalteromonas sp. HM-SA03 TaxID=2029678 RepID=UPI000BADEAEA|nr:hypothetical protein [Pseudoalteromonas sp. HM-SA03]PAX99086.1 hypothetical protein CKO50_22745 [Pseudoalteromonas sp. HM-SA03]
MIFSVPQELSNLAVLVIVVLIVPVLLTSGIEFLLTKKVTWLLAGFVFSVSVLILTLLLIQLNSSKVLVSKSSIKFESLFYSRTIEHQQVEQVSPLYEHGLPNRYQLSIRTNGVSLNGYHAGSYRLKDNTEAFVLMSAPPYAVVEVKNKQYIFSLNEDMYKLIVEELSN